MRTGVRRSRRAAARRVGWAVSVLLLLAQAAPAEPCAPWPGEPVPLPRVDDPDEMRSRWATLRVGELSNLAAAYERTAPVTAHRLWRRVLCLDPTDDRAVAGLARIPLVVVHQPLLVRGLVQDDVRNPWAGLGRPLALRPPPRRPPPVAEPASAPAPPDRFGPAFDAAQEHLQAARFEEALEAAETARGVAASPGSSADADRRAALEVVAGTAALALGRQAEAEASFARALEAQPGLTLDPAQTPPKVRRTLDRVRSVRSAR